MKHKNNKGIEAFVGMQTKISRGLIELKVFDKITTKKDSGSTESQMAEREGFEPSGPCSQEYRA